MCRRSIRLLSDANSITPNLSSRALRQRHPLPAPQELHRYSPEPFFRCPGSRFFLPFARICRPEFDSWARPCWVFAQLQLQSFSTESRFCVRQIDLPLHLTNNSEVYKQLPPFVPSRRFSQFLLHDSTCLCEVKRSEIQASRLDFRLKLHSAALELPYELSSPPEAASVHMHFDDTSPLQPSAMEVHGTLNTVLWGIPMIANQMSFKSTEGRTVTEDLIQAVRAQEACSDSLQLPQVTEILHNRVIKNVPSMSPEVLEAPANSSHLPHLESRAFAECIEEPCTKAANLSTQSKESQKQITVVVSPQESSRVKYDRLRWRQIKLETESWQRATDECKQQLCQMCKNKLAPNLPFIKKLFLSWFEPLTKAISAEQEAYRRGEGAMCRSCYGPYLDLLPADKLAVITMHKTIARLLSEDGLQGVKISIPILSIGEAVEREVKLQQFMEKKHRKKKKEQEAADDEVSNEQLKKRKPLLKKVERLIKQKKLRMLTRTIKELDSSEPWSKSTQANVGSRLLELLIETAYVQDPRHQPPGSSMEVRPAFRHSIKTVKKESIKKGTCTRKFGILECDCSISRGVHSTTRAVVPYMPMLVKPLRWHGYMKGGHLVFPNCIMRTHGSKDLREAFQKTPNRQLKAVYEALDTLGSTQWRINTRVLEVVEKIWEEGGRIADMVDRNDVPEPQKPESDDADVQKKWRRELLKVKRVNRELHSQRCDTELKLFVARQMKNEECFYYPHNVDFRGRAYPLHAHLNHLGSDMCRGLLEFAQGSPLKKAGLRWLKIHLANLYGNGVDKLSYNDRVAFVDGNMDNILDSARRPLEGSRWWLAAEDPFQILATCMEVSDALASPNVEEFNSHIPVHQDGSCNGLQHYAALGRDVLGAESVNLTPQGKPADVYTDIAVRVKRLLEKDFSDESLNTIARLLYSQVDRKLVKQTVMTSVYGVTYIGARDQILSRLQERHSIEDEKQAYNASCYAAKVTLAALGEMFKSARIIMGWLGDCARIIASQNQPVKWKTPLGLPVVQPYRRLARITIKTSLQVLALTDDDSTRVMARRQKTAFPPNFVHSLDGSHMMMTANACKKAGLTFAGVHDSFWTHAGDVDKMNVILRQKFVELYNRPILEDLRKDFQKNFPDVDFPPIPARGDFDLQQVLQAPYFFN